MKHTLRTVFCLLMALLLTVTALPAFAAAPKKPNAQKLATIGTNQMQFNNNTGASITEVYIYPNYSSKVGDARNKGWIKKQQSGIITITATEARRDCLWNMIIVFKPQSGYSFRVTWEDLDLSYYLGNVVEITVTDNGYYNIHVIDGSYSSLEFDFYNDTGYTLTEVYFYAANSSSFGQPRNTKELYDQGSLHIKFNQVEATSTVQWNMRIYFKQGYRTYYVEYEDVDLSYFNNGTLVVTIDRDGYFTYYRYEDSF